MPPTGVRWNAARLLAEDLVPVPEPLALALRPGPPRAPQAVASHAARALLDLPPVAPQPPPWLAPHQVPALTRLCGLLRRYGGALLADAVGMGKSYVAVALARELSLPTTLVVPAVLVPQWKRLLGDVAVVATVVTHEQLSSRVQRTSAGGGEASGLLIVDEAHRFRNPETRRYQRLAARSMGARVLLVTATPVHNRVADLIHLFRLFLRDDALTALGVGSLARAARGEPDPETVAAVAARLVVARSRRRAASAVFPARSRGTVVRAGSASDATLAALVRGVAALRCGGRAASLVRMVLLRRLASSLPAFRATLARYRAFADVAAEAARAGRRLGAADFQRLFPREDGPDMQLSLLPLVLESGASDASWDDAGLDALDQLARCAAAEEDAKLAALERLLAAEPRKTIVFAEARETVRHLLRQLRRRRRVAAVEGHVGWFGDTKASVAAVFAAFAPVSRRVPPPPEALRTDVLLATDLASEGLNLQDAARVIHYDVPWTPARLAQRVGRIDRLGSQHRRIATATLLPPPALARALDMERRLAGKVTAQRTAGTAQRETVRGKDRTGASLDWCDRLQALAGPGGTTGWTLVAGRGASAVLVVRLGTCCDVLVVRNGSCRADAAAATHLLEEATRESELPPDRAALDAAIRVAVPVVRERLTALETARWRATDRDRLARRLVPWVLAAARRAARAGDALLLARLDHLVTRLTLGMTAGEELALHALLERRESLAVRDLLAWHDRLPPVTAPPDAPDVELIAAVVFRSLPPATGKPHQETDVDIL